MDVLDREILFALLGSHKSMYALDKSLKNTNYPTVLRHIRKMQEEKLLTTIKRHKEDGKLDKRKAEIPELTPKGLATLLIEGDLKEEELKSVMIKTLQRGYPNLPPNFLGITNVDKVYADTLLRVRQKINLKFFDQEYFNEVFNVSFGETLFEIFKDVKITRNILNEKKAQRLKYKYISNQTIEDFRNLRKTFENESNKFKRYSNAIAKVIQALTALNN